MPVRFNGPGNIATQIPTLQPIAVELVPALRDTSAAAPGVSNTGERS